MKKYPTFVMGTLLLATLALQACSDSDDRASAGTTMRSYEVTVVNLTNNQPFSPLAAILHKSTYQGMTLGASASPGLETLAESGDNSPFLADANANTAVSDTASGAGLIASGTQETVMLTGSETRLTLASMLVNTNDAIAALNGIELGNMALNEVMTLHARAYDAGTEDNNEANSDVPGPAADGEGFNATRNDRDFVIVHPGVIGMEDGLSTSVLTEAHRFDNAVAKITIKRTS